MNYKDLARTLVDGALDGGGITIDLDGEQSVSSAYLVGGAVPSRVIRTLGLSHDEIVVDVSNWLWKNAERLPGHVLGSWHDTGGYGEVDEIHIDLVTVLGYYGGLDYDAMADIAIALGRVRGEKAVGYIDSDGAYAEEFTV